MVSQAIAPVGAVVAGEGASSTWPGGPVVSWTQLPPDSRLLIRRPYDGTAVAYVGWMPWRTPPS